MRTRLLSPVLVLAALALALLLSLAGPGTQQTKGASPRAAPAETASSPLARGFRQGHSVLSRSRHRPNIVFVLTDDLSLDLLRYMPQVQALAARGMTLGNYFVSDSLCCPSRASIFTGLFPHDSGVFTNDGFDGGMTAFVDHGDPDRSFNIALQRVGYRTAMMGKYINGYLGGPNRSPVPDNYVPPGWNEWDVAGWGYPEFDYTLNENGTLHYFGHSAADYLTAVLARRAVAFIKRRAHERSPFFLELATFAPHTPYVPAPQDRRSFPGLVAPRPRNFDRLPVNPPSWLAGHPRLSRRKLARINRAFRLRVQDVQSVDRMLAHVEQALAADGLLGDTYVVFSSDNGLHTGEYRLMPGKLTAFDTDVHVPLVVAGPGVDAGSSTPRMTENIDLAETFAQIGGASWPHGDGHSLLGLLHGARQRDWRNAVLIEHHGPGYDPTVDPDAQTGLSGNPPSYEAMRTPAFLYVEYADGEREFYDLRSDPFELDNLAQRLGYSELDTLHRQLARLESCHGAGSCWKAGHVAVRPATLLSSR